MTDIRSKLYPSVNDSEYDHDDDYNNNNERTPLLSQSQQLQPPPQQQQQQLQPSQSQQTKSLEGPTVVHPNAKPKHQKRQLLIIYFSTFCNMFALQMCSPVIYLYFVSRGWATDDPTGEDNATAFYGYVYAFTAIMPAFYSPSFGAWAGARGYKEVMVIGSLVALGGFATIALTGNRYVFAIGYGLVFVVESLRRTIHQAYIARWVLRMFCVCMCVCVCDCCCYCCCCCCCCCCC